MRQAWDICHGLHRLIGISQLELCCHVSIKDCPEVMTICVHRCLQSHTFRCLELCTVTLILLHSHGSSLVPESRDEGADLFGIDSRSICPPRHCGAPVLASCSSVTWHQVHVEMSHAIARDVHVDVLRALSDLE